MQQGWGQVARDKLPNSVHRRDYNTSTYLHGCLFPSLGIGKWSTADIALPPNLTQHQRFEYDAKVFLKVSMAQTGVGEIKPNTPYTVRRVADDAVVELHDPKMSTVDGIIRPYELWPRQPVLVCTIIENEIQTPYVDTQKITT